MRPQPVASVAVSLPAPPERAWGLVAHVAREPHWVEEPAAWAAFALRVVIVAGAVAKVALVVEAGAHWAPRQWALRIRDKT